MTVPLTSSRRFSRAAGASDQSGPIVIVVVVDHQVSEGEHDG